MTAGAAGEPCRSGEPDAREREEPEDDREPRTVGKTLGDDRHVSDPAGSVASVVSESTRYAPA